MRIVTVGASSGLYFAGMFLQSNFVVAIIAERFAFSYEEIPLICSVRIMTS
jgi:hypothetical protein